MLMSEQGADIKRRRKRLGMSITDLADEAKVSRDTLSDIEAGEVQPRVTTLSKIENTLARIEEEVGYDAPLPPPEEPDLMEIVIEGVYGIRSVVVKGPVRDADLIREQATQLIRDVQAGKPDES